MPTAHLLQLLFGLMIIFAALLQSASLIDTLDQVGGLDTLLSEISVIHRPEDMLGVSRACECSNDRRILSFIEVLGLVVIKP